MRRAVKICLIIIILLIGFVWTWLEFPFLVPPFRYLLFMHRSQGYYARIGKACSLILAKNPVKESDEVKLTSDMIVPDTKKIFADDPSVPSIVRRLGPDFILVSDNRVTISVPLGPMAGGFGIAWWQETAPSYRWDLQAAADEGPEMVTVYSTTNN
jgi:hypothetical protein